MALDLKRLKRDLRAQDREAVEGDARVKPSGAMAIVRKHLPDIERLKAEGATWVAIAAALARQGVSMRDGRPLTGRRLTGLIDSIRRQDAGRREAGARRLFRSDLAPGPPSARAPSSPDHPEASAARPTDAPAAVPTTPHPEHRTAEQIRREGLSDLYDLLKGKKP
ncbi:hypothetical protein D3273_02120 [Lichenibacterium minor]|uniref:Uncharacterized protein n=1 Tax=Lichenibacterium minor TaxID=2316528 RepID=A0A4Q2UAZ1_9HYPH|nr:hypothetical protein [Lichenibacterium minor]RYC34069.1 hypothetical protein D3273_02120 [Lichenibacterium minor]